MKAARRLSATEGVEDGDRGWSALDWAASFESRDPKFLVCSGSRGAGRSTSAAGMEAFGSNALVTLRTRLSPSAEVRDH